MRERKEEKKENKELREENRESGEGGRKEERGNPTVFLDPVFTEARCISDILHSMS